MGQRLSETIKKKLWKIFSKEEHKMFVPSLFFSAIPMGVITYDFTPLFVGLVVGVCLCVLVLAVTIGIHDTRRLQQREKTTGQSVTPASELPDAA